MPTDPERLAIDHVAQRLSRQFATLDTDLVAKVVWDTYRHFDAHPTRDVVPILVQDAARDRLQLQRQQLQFTDQPQSPLRSRPPPSPGEVLVPGPHCRDLHRAHDAWFERATDRTVAGAVPTA